MRTTPAINKTSVRRRLFSEPDTCADDNWFNSTISKIYDDDAERLRTQWNFDPETDLPLDGPITWVRGHGAFDWIGTVKEDKGKEDQENLPKDSFTTPRRKRSVSAPPVRKRRIDDINVDMSKNAKRRISFP